MMKQFISTNWYRLMTATAMLIFAFAFLVFVLQNNVARAGTPVTNQTANQNKWIVANDKGIFEITWQKYYPYYKSNIIFNENGK